MKNCLVADWPVNKQLLAFTTTRVGGASSGGFDSWNTATHVGDNPHAVAKNRAQLAALLPLKARLHWLEQVHGVEVLRIDSQSDANSVRQADGLYTQCRHQALIIQTADCLPVLLCDEQGTEIAALHAGWRGLAGGILQRGVAQFESTPSRLLAWIGPAISVRHFRIGNDVKEQLISALPSGHTDQLFATDPNNDDYCFADLVGLASAVLRSLGLTRIFGGRYCSYEDSRRFYSYRRDKETGRNATLIMLR